MTVKMHRARRRGWVLQALAACGLFALACGSDSRNPVVMEMQGRKVTVDDLRIEYDLRNQPGDFDRATLEQKEQFLRTIADKDLLVREARAALGGLTPDETRRVQQGGDERLFRSLEMAVTAAVDADTLGAQQIVKEKGNREVRLLHFAGPTDSIAFWARDEVVNGRATIGELVSVHGVDPYLREQRGQLNWMTAVPLGYELADELILDPKPIGYITEVRRTVRGWEFFQVQEYRDFDLSSSKDLPSMTLATVQKIRHQHTMRDFLDSLKAVHKLEVLEEGGNLLMAAMSGYWDSLSTSVQETGKRPTEFHPPRWRVPADRLSTPLYRADGKEVSIASFLAGLGTVNPRNWPNAVKYEHFKMQIEARVMIDFQLAEARRRGLDREPSHLAAVRQDEEKLLLDRFYAERLSEGIEITDEEIRQRYEEIKDQNYKQSEKIRLSYLIYPKQSEAQRFIEQAKQRDHLWWGAELKRHQDERPDVQVVSNSPDYDPRDEVPADVKPLIEAGVDHGAGTVVGVVRVPSGWAALRVTYREHEGHIPLEKASNSVRSSILNAKIDEKVNGLLEKGRESYRQKLYPERLAETG